MKNMWSDESASECRDELDLRVYTSNLLGQSDELVLHGGGNTSVKVKQGEIELLLVKGSGWDLVNIKREGFAPVALDALCEMAELEALSDGEMVRLQREAMTDISAPNPSVEAILHAIIPFKFVDHTHADAVVTITNSHGGKERIEKLFSSFLVVDYVMPGFELAKKIRELTRNLDWSECQGIILLNHGIFTFDNDAKRSYEKMIDAVTKAEEYLALHAKLDEILVSKKAFDVDVLLGAVQEAKRGEQVMVIDESVLALRYSYLPKGLLERGVLTPEHIIRTKRIPLVLKNESVEIALEKFVEVYRDYFRVFAKDEIMLNPAPNYAVVEGFGVVCFGKNIKEAQIISDIISHTMQAVLRADMLGGYVTIGLGESFAMEYWELEQAKLRRES